MTIGTAPTPLIYNGDGVTTNFPITWKYFAKSHVVAILRNASGSEAVWVLSTNYTLTAAGVEAGGTLTATVAPAIGETLVITLEPPNTQAASLPLGGPFPSTSVEDGLDIAAQRDSNLRSLINRALLVPKSDSHTGSNLEIPIDSSRAGKFLAFDGSGNPIAAAGTSANLGPVSAFINTFLDDDDAETARTTLGIPSVIIRKNVLFNGDLNVWQAGTSFTGITTTQNVADEWSHNVLFQGTWTVAQNADVPTVTQAGRNLNFSIRATVTTPDATTNVADNVHIRAAVEGFNYAPLFEQTQTIRFWAKSNLIGTYCVSLRNSSLDRSYVQTFTIDAANTWELKTVTITSAPGIGGIWNFQTGVGVYLSFALAAGTNFQTGAGSWSAGNFIATTAQVNLAATASNYFALADVRLVPGSDASNIIIPTFSEQLAIAQRYYEKSFQYATAPAQNVGAHTGCAFFTQIVGAATQQFGSRIGFKVRKRAIPSVVTTFNPFAANAQARNATIGVDCSGTVTDNLSEEGCHIFFTTPAGSAAGQAIAVHWTSDSRL